MSELNDVLYRPFGDVFAGSLAPVLLDSVGNPGKAPTDPRALIANSRAAAPLVHAALVVAPAAATAADARSAIWMLVDLGCGPWVWTLSATLQSGSGRENSYVFDLPGITAKHKLQCVLKRSSTSSPWILEDSPDAGKPPRQLAAVRVQNRSSQKGRFCFCGGSNGATSGHIVCVIPKVNDNNCCAQFRPPRDQAQEDGLWGRYLARKLAHVEVFQGTVEFSPESTTNAGDSEVSIEVKVKEKFKLQAGGQPCSGLLKFDFGAPLSLAQAFACALVASLEIPGSGVVNSDEERLALASKNQEGGVAWPQHWLYQGDDVGCHMLRESELAREFLQSLVDSTFRSVRTRDRGKQLLPCKLHVLTALRMENPDQWRRFQYRKHLVRSARRDQVVPMDPPPLTTTSVAADSMVVSGLDADVNEHYLFHGTCPAAAHAIQSSGFDLGRAGTNKGKFFGGGLYFAEASSKADEYATLLSAEEDVARIRQAGSQHRPEELRCMLFCRVVCGQWHRTEQPLATLEKTLDRRQYDSVVGDRKAAVGTYREFIVYEEAHVYAEYIILYSRCFDDTRVAPSLVDTSGHGFPDTLMIDSGSGLNDTPVKIDSSLMGYVRHLRDVQP